MSTQNPAPEGSTTMTRGRKSLAAKTSTPEATPRKRSAKGKVLLGAVEGGMTGAGIGGAAASVVPGVGTVIGGVVGGSVGVVAGAKTAQAEVAEKEALEVAATPRASTPPAYEPSIPIQYPDAENGVSKDITGREF